MRVLFSLVALVLFGAQAAAQTASYSPQPWGIDKSANPYKLGVNVGGTWRSPATLSSTGEWTIPSIGIAPTWASLGLVPNSPSSAAANCTQFNALITQASISTKKVIELPADGSAVWTSCTIDMKFSGVTLRSAARDANHGATTTPPTPHIVAATGMTTPVISMRSPYGSTHAKQSGIWLENISIDGSRSTGPAIDVDSVSDGGIRGVYVSNSHSATAAIYFHAGVSRTDLADAADIQHFWVEATVRQIDDATAQTVPCARFDSSSNANFSFNPYVKITCQHTNQTAFIINSADNNHFLLRANRAGAGTGDTLLCVAPNPTNPAAKAVGCDLNVFEYISGPGAIKIQGTETAGATKGVHNRIEWLDGGNGTPVPVVGTGSLLDVTSNTGWAKSFPHVKGVFTEGASYAPACQARSGAESIRICNTAENGLVFDDTGVGAAAANSFAFRIKAGDLNILNLTGGGRVTVTPTIMLGNMLLLKVYSVASLPACNAAASGAMTYVNDATAPTYNGALAGGGTVKVPVFCNGTAWTSH